MDDYVSRKAVIDAVQFAEEGIWGWKGQITDAVNKLPSTQPEIIRCKDCKYWRINYYQDVETCFEHRNVDGTEQATSPEDYCSWAERRKDE